MNNLKEYIIEKLHIDKDYFHFDEEEFSKMMQSKYAINNTSIFYKYFTKWIRKYKVSDFEIIGWYRINNTMNTTEYIGNDSLLEEYMNILEKDSEEITPSEDLLGRKILQNEKYFGFINTEKRNISIVAEKIK